MLREIENRFGASQYLQKNSDLIQVPKSMTRGGGSGLSTPGSPVKQLKKAVPLSIVKRTKPVPPVGYYDDVSDLYIRTTQPKAKGLTSLSSDKLPKFIFKPRDLHPEPTDNLAEFQQRQEFFRWNQARTGQNTHDFSQVPDRAKTHFLRE